MVKADLSVIMATYNEEKNLPDCLKSIKDIAKEITIIDGSSNDDTIKIAQSFGAKVYITTNKLMFHENKQLGLEKAQGDWILQLDADERVTTSLCEEIKILKIKNEEEINGYFIPRKNYFLGKWLKKGGQYPDYVIRLVRKNKAFFPCQTVHEQIEVFGKVKYLKNPLIHLAYPNLNSYFKKAKIYTQETANRIYKEKSNKVFKVIKYLVLKPIFTFFNIYFRHKGFLDSWQGLMFALFSSLHYPWAYIKSLKK